MNVQSARTDDPILPELLRSRLEAIGQEAGAAVVQTAISPIVTESKDYSVTILDADGSIVSASGLIDLHYGAVMHAVRSTIAVHGDTIAPGDVFIANDPHSGGGLHPQDVVIQRPVFVDGKRVAWVALAAHMMDMGGMVPGSSAVEATECYQEALRLPPVRLIDRGTECEDVWNIIRINLRSSDLIEMDMRSLVVGGAVAEAKLVELIGEMGYAQFKAAGESLIDGCLRVLRERIARIEDGFYFSTAWIEWGNGVMRIPCNMEVRGDRVIFDLSEAPPQVPSFINSKEYIIRAQIAPRMRQLLAPGLPYNQAVLDIVEIICKPGTIVHCTMPAPIGAAAITKPVGLSRLSRTRSSTMGLLLLRRCVANCCTGSRNTMPDSVEVSRRCQAFSPTVQVGARCTSRSERWIIPSMLRWLMPCACPPATARGAMRKCLRLLRVTSLLPPP